jgi:hypothetical protein
VYIQWTAELLADITLEHFSCGDWLQNPDIFCGSLFRNFYFFDVGQQNDIKCFKSRVHFAQDCLGEDCLNLAVTI